MSRSIPWRFAALCLGLVLIAAASFEHFIMSAIFSARYLKNAGDSTDRLLNKTSPSELLSASMPGLPSLSTASPRLPFERSAHVCAHQWPGSRGCE